MYIVAIAWLYVTLMMAITEKNLVSGIMTFLFYGLFPLALVLWLLGGPSRNRRRRSEAEGRGAVTADKSEDEVSAAIAAEPGSMAQEHVQHPDGAHPKRDE